MNLGDRLIANSLKNLDTGCMEWQGGKFRGGYGAITVSVDGADKLKKVHRVAYELFVGELVPGMVICHHCDNPPCWEPTHLFQGTVQDNVLDAFAKGRRKAPPEFLAANPNRGKTHCLRGHAFDEANTHYSRTGGRKCRKCHADRERSKRHARKLENPS